MNTTSVGIEGIDGKTHCPVCDETRFCHSYGGSWQCLNGHRFTPPPEITQHKALIANCRCCGHHTLTKVRGILRKYVVCTICHCRGPRRPTTETAILAWGELQTSPARPKA